MSAARSCVLCVLARVHQTSRAYRAKMLAQNAGAPKMRSAHGCCSAQRVRRHVTARRAVGCSSRAGRCHRPAEPSCLRSAARVGWRRRAPCRPRTSYVLALGAKQPAPNRQCRVHCARRLIWPIRALRQQAATYGSEWPRESGAHPWRVPTHSGFTRPRSGMKGPDWGLAGAGTTVKKAAMRRMRFYPSHFRTVRPAP